MAMEDDIRRALIIVDVQPTFCEGGALAVEGGNAVAERIADFVTEYADEYEFIVTTQDWHINPGKHFSDHPDFVDTWPPHGVAGTAEAELHEAIASLSFDDSVKKGQYSAAYSGFEGTNEAGESLEELLREREIQALDVVGIAESHCVMETALDGVKKGWPVRVFSDLTVPVSEELGCQARKDMDEAGVDQLASSEAFGFYEEGEDAPIPGEDEYDADGEDSVFGGGSDYGEEDGFGDGAEDGYGSQAWDFEAEDEFGEDFSEDFGEDFSSGDIDLDDPLFDLDADFGDDLDADFDFSADATDDDFDFSDIDLGKELK